MSFRLTADEIWENLELKLQQVRRNIQKRDELLSINIESLINHYNGNKTKGTQYKCLTNFKQILDNIKRDEYFSKRMYREKEMLEVQELKDDFNLIIVALERDEREVFTKECAERKDLEKRAKSGLPLHEAVDENRLPNLETDRAFSMMDRKTDERNFK